MAKISMKGRGCLLIGWSLGLYIGAYAFLCALGFFDLARLPWNNQEDSIPYRLFLPLEWVRKRITEAD